MVLESPKSVPTTPSKLIYNPFEITDNDTQQDESLTTTTSVTEVEEKKIIQKENINTGSVSLLFF